MTVGDDEAFYLVDVPLQIGNIRDNQVNTQHIVGRESKTAVYDHDGIFVLKRGNVHADLLQAA